MGTLVYGKRPRKGNPEQELVRVEGFFPTILNGNEWQLLQERLSIRRESSRGRTHSSVYLLSGMARCGYCGGPMAGKVAATNKVYSTGTTGVPVPPSPEHCVLTTTDIPLPGLIQWCWNTWASSPTLRR